MRVYLSGAITGVKHADKLFARAEEKLELEGYDVVNPYKFGEYLKKENAELKEKLNFSTQYYQGEKAKEQLTKAKEIIKDFILMAKVERLKDRYETVDEAEQFLKDSIE